jgi:hypothetical protein
MKQQVTRDLYSYWTKIRGDRAAPERANIDPAAIRGLLNDTFMVEAEATRGYQIKLVGARISALFLNEVKGQRFPDLFNYDDRDSLRALLDSVVDDPTPVVAGIHAAPPGYAPLDLELLLLPVGLPGASRGNRILGSLAPATTPAWAGLIATSPLRLNSLRILQQPGAPTSLPPHLLPWANVPLGQSGNVPKLTLGNANITIYKGENRSRTISW